MYARERENSFSLNKSAKADGRKRRASQKALSAREPTPSLYSSAAKPMVPSSGSSVHRPAVEHRNALCLPICFQKTPSFGCSRPPSLFETKAGGERRVSCYKVLLQRHRETLVDGPYAHQVFVKHLVHMHYSFCCIYPSANILRRTGRKSMPAH